MNCYLCSIFLPNESFLSKHFRLAHNKKIKSTYKCTYDDCGKHVANMGHFKQHFQDHLLQSQTDSGSSICIADLSLAHPVVKPTSTPEENKTILNDCFPPSSSAENCSNLSLLSTSDAATFLLSCHNKSNLTRKDVQDIHDSTVSYILSPISHEIDTFLQENHLEDKLTVKLSALSLKNKILNIFSECENENKLRKWLTSEECVDQLKIFVINNEIEEVYTKGETFLEANTVTGTLMPLYFQFKKFFEKNVHYYRY